MTIVKKIRLYICLALTTITMGNAHGAESSTQDEWPAYSLTLDIHRRNETPAYVKFTLMDRGHEIGHINGYLPYADDVYGCILSLNVENAWQGKGVGSWLLQLFTKECDKRVHGDLNQGLKLYSLTGSVSFYEKHGFVKENPNAINGPFDMIRKKN